MYSIIELPLLHNSSANDLSRNLVESYFEIDRVIRPVNLSNCISVSFFCQHVENTYINQYGEKNDCFDTSSDWYQKYYINFAKFVDDFNKSAEFFPTWKIRVYLERRLDSFIDRILGLSEHLEIYYMKTDSIGAQPGMLWRFISFDDTSLDVVHCSDIDMDFSWAVPKIRAFLRSNKTLGRYMAYYTCDGIIDQQNPETSPINYTVVMGSCISFRPKKSDFSIKQTVIDYILYRNERLKTDSPSEEFDDQNTQRYNKPIGRHSAGWGGIWTMYGFDEKYWKHIAFPHLAKKGEVLTWTDYDATILETIHAPNHKKDYEFTKSYPNEFVHV